MVSILTSYSGECPKAKQCVRVGSDLNAAICSDSHPLQKTLGTTVEGAGASPLSLSWRAAYSSMPRNRLLPYLKE